MQFIFPTATTKASTLLSATTAPAAEFALGRPHNMRPRGLHLDGEPVDWINRVRERALNISRRVSMVGCKDNAGAIGNRRSFSTSSDQESKPESMASVGPSILEAVLSIISILPHVALRPRQHRVTFTRHFVQNTSSSGALPGSSVVVRRHSGASPHSAKRKEEKEKQRGRTVCKPCARAGCSPIPLASSDVGSYSSSISTSPH